MPRTLHIAAAIAVLLALTIPASGAAGRFLASDHPLIKLLGALKVERGREHRALLVVPIVADQPDPDKTIRPATPGEAARAEELSIGEPAKGTGRGPVELFNWSTRPILLLAGDVLKGGRRDRFLKRDVLLRPGGKATAPALPADQKPRPSKESERSLQAIGALAPDLLRLLGVMDGSAQAVKSFLEDEFALAGTSSKRGSVVDLFETKTILERIAEYKTLFKAIPDEANRRVIGVAALVGDRIVGIDLFPTNAAFRANWPRILRTLSFQASLYELSYGLLKTAFANVRDPDRQRLIVEELLRKVFSARARKVDAVDLGEEVLLVKDELIGRVLWHDEKVVHAVLLLDLLTAPPEAAPPVGDGNTERVSEGSLSRRAARGGRLTEYEKRLLERMRRRRTTPANPGGSGGETPRIPEPGSEESD